MVKDVELVYKLRDGTIWLYGVLFTIGLGKYIFDLNYIKENESLFVLRIGVTLLGFTMRFIKHYKFSLFFKNISKNGIDKQGNAKIRFNKVGNTYTNSIYSYQIEFEKNGGYHYERGCFNSLDEGINKLKNKLGIFDIFHREKVGSSFIYYVKFRNYAVAKRIYDSGINI